MPARKNPSDAIRFFAETLKRQRNKEHLKQSYCAGALGVSLRQYKRLERGQCFPSVGTRRKLKVLFPTVLDSIIRRRPTPEFLQLLRRR